VEVRLARVSEFYVSRIKKKEEKKRKEKEKGFCGMKLKLFYESVLVFGTM